MRTSENLGHYDRGKQHYPNDPADEEWTHAAPLIPPGKQGDSKRRMDLREVVNGLM